MPLRGGFVCAARKVLVPAGGYGRLRRGFVPLRGGGVSLCDGFFGLRPDFTAAKRQKTVAEGHTKPQRS